MSSSFPEIGGRRTDVLAAATYRLTGDRRPGPELHTVLLTDGTETPARSVVPATGLS